MTDSTALHCIARLQRKSNALVVPKLEPLSYLEFLPSPQLPMVCGLILTYPRGFALW
jgi:hypothetical protein